MPICKICGKTVLAGPVMHAGCLEREVSEAAEEFCDSYCVWPDMYTSQEQLEREHCDSCPMDRLMELVKQDRK